MLCKPCDHLMDANHMGLRGHRDGDGDGNGVGN